MVRSYHPDLRRARGGHLFGAPEQDDRANEAFVCELGIARRDATPLAPVL